MAVIWPLPTRGQYWLLLGLLVLTCGAVFAVTSLFYIAIPTYPSGDEPHYLVISQTLLKYHSLNVMQDYSHGDYHLFYPLPITPHVAPNLRGQLLPVHGIGGPVLWLIPFALFGRNGVIFFMSLVTLLIVITVYLLLNAMGVRPRYAFLVSLGYSIASPFYIYSHLAFIEPIAALIVIYVFKNVIQERVSLIAVIISSVLLGLLPWIHIRFAVIEMSLFFVLAFRIYRMHAGDERGRWRKLTRYYVAYLVPVAFLFVLFELYNYREWGTFNPAANQASMENQPFMISPATGIVGMLFDQEYGLFINFPLFLFLFVGIMTTLKRRFLMYHVSVLLVSIPYLLLVTTLGDWTGGWCPPARFILALLPVYAFYLGYALEYVDTLFAALVFGLLLSYGFFYDVLALKHAFNRKIGQNLTIVNLKVFQHSITDYLPSLFVQAQPQRAHLVPSQHMLFEVWIGLYLGITVLVLATRVAKENGRTKRIANWMFSPIRQAQRGST